jgi:hypothetical protein
MNILLKKVSLTNSGEIFSISIISAIQEGREKERQNIFKTTFEDAFLNSHDLKHNSDVQYILVECLN